MSMPCPHCSAVAHVRTSRLMSPISKEMYYQCSNLECGHTFVGVIEVVRTLSPSACPNPSVQIRQYKATAA
ncbi:DNA-binding transcriptional regulator [compost metagenome]